MATQMMSNGDSFFMDPEVWGKLQNYIDLNSIYAKMPFPELFRLRLVCKAWNRLASHQEFLESKFKDPMPKPYFIVAAESEDWMHGLLAYDVSSSSWTWTKLPSLDYRSGVKIVDGLIYSYNYNKESEQQVLNVHTKVCHMLPEALEITLNDPFVGMIVDTSVSPYRFRIILGSSDIHTQIYDSVSNSWTQKSSDEPPEMAPGRASCAYCKGILYIRSELDEINTYDLERDIWGTMDPPPGDCDDYLRHIGAWQDRLFDVTVNEGERWITAWVLADHPQQEWTPFDRMPEDLYSWLTYADDPDPPVRSVDIQILTSFCGEYVLVYTWLVEESLAERFVMCNLDRRAWKRVEMPLGACSISKDVS